MVTVIFDIDGTLANNEHRQHFLEKNPKDWDGFFEAMVKDKPVEPICNLLSALWLSCNLVICTGRPEKYRQKTLTWLNQYVLRPHYRATLLMRPDGDYRPDHEVKKEMLDKLRAEGHDIWFVVDDRKSVVDMWRTNGVTCLQCAEGDF